MNLSAEQIEAAARSSRERFGKGFHCAEAVALCVSEALGRDPSEAVKCATPFGGGFGKSYEEACGALSGGLIAVGQVAGRNEPGVDWDEPADMGAALRTVFVNRFGTTCCRVLRDRFGEAQMDECRNIVGEMTAETLKCISRKG